MSAFIEESLRQQIERRRMQKEFIIRGLAAQETAKSSAQYASKDEVMDSLKSILDASKQQK